MINWECRGRNKDKGAKNKDKEVKKLPNLDFESLFLAHYSLILLKNLSHC